MSQLAKVLRLVSLIDDDGLRADIFSAIGDLIGDGHRDRPNSKGAIKTRRWREKKRSHGDQSVTDCDPLKVSPEVPSFFPPHTPPNNYPPNPLPKPQKDSCASPSQERREREREFEGIWKLFPRKVGKGHALKAYIAARKQTDFETIRKGVERHREQIVGREPEFIPHPATWLNGKRWLDEPGLNLVVDNISQYRRPQSPPKIA